MDWNAQRLAVLDHDIDAVIRTHAKDRRVAAWLEDTAEALEEIGEIELAIDWAKQATDFDRGHQSLKAADYWCRLLEQHRPAEPPPRHACDLNALTRDLVVRLLCRLAPAPRSRSRRTTEGTRRGGSWHRRRSRVCEGGPVSKNSIRSHQESVTVEAPPETLYRLVSDITRTGEWSPVCTSCWWDDEDEAGQVGAWFTGRNELPDRTWETRSQVVVAERDREFAWVVGGSFVRWGFTLTPAETSTTLTESWEFLPDGIAMFKEKYGDHAQTQISERTRQALEGIPQTLAAIKRIAESSTEAGGTRSS